MGGGTPLPPRGRANPLQKVEVFGMNKGMISYSRWKQRGPKASLYDARVVCAASRKACQPPQPQSELLRWPPLLHIAQRKATIE